MSRCVLYLSVSLLFYLLSEEGDIKWSPIGSTRMAGLEDMMKQEGMYLKALPGTEQMSVEGTHLYFFQKISRQN